MKVEVVYALPDVQEVITLELPEPCNVKRAVEASGLLDKYPEIDLSVNKVGIFSRLTTLEQLLREGDRVELYRPLIADPKEVRRRKAAEKKASQK